MKIPPRTSTYLITSNRLDADAGIDSPAFHSLLNHVAAATKAGVSLIQLREKQLPARALYELASACVALTRGTPTRLLVNDRADIARAAGADGVHLTSASLPTDVVRKIFGANFLIGVSTHTADEAARARDAGADFATFSPIYETPSKAHLNLPPVGLNQLRYAAQSLAPFPLVALGGIDAERINDVLCAGAAGIAGIRLFDEKEELAEVVRKVNEYEERIKIRARKN